MAKRYRLHKADANKVKKHPFFVVVKRLIALGVGRVEVQELENIPNEPCILVPNHSGAFGPICVLAYYKRKMRPFVISKMCKMKTAPDFARRDFFSPKSAFGRGVARVLSYPVAFLCQGIFIGAEAVPAHFDRNVVYTLRKASDALSVGVDLIIFPEERVYHSPYIEKFQRGFIAVARKHYKQTKQCVKFVPTFASPSRKIMRFGKPITFDPTKNYTEHCEEIRVYLQNAVEAMAIDMGSDPEYKPED